MKWLIFSLFTLLGCLGAAAASSPAPDTVWLVRTDTLRLTDTVHVTDTVRIAPARTHADTAAVIAPYQRRIERITSFWNRLIPSGTRLQFAGNMGLLSGGVTWIYGRRHWETSLLFGFVPKHSAKHAMATMTLKQDYIPWTVRLGRWPWLQFQPLAAGVYLNTVFSHKFWVHQPSRYPRGYYWFATRLRPNIYIGERLRLALPSGKRQFARAVSIFYEISTCDYAAIQRLHNSYITPDKWLTLSLGIQFEWF